MPVLKFKTFEAAEKVLWNFDPDENYFQQVAELWSFADKLSRPAYPAGVFKFKTLEEANKHRDDLEREYAASDRAP